MTTLTIRIDELEKELLWEYAEERDMSISQILRRLIKEFLDKEIGR